MDCDNVEEALDALNVLLDRSVAALLLRYPESREQIQTRIRAICDETKDWWAEERTTTDNVGGNVVRAVAGLPADSSTTVQPQARARNDEISFAEPRRSSRNKKVPDVGIPDLPHLHVGGELIAPQSGNRSLSSPILEPCSDNLSHGTLKNRPGIISTPSSANCRVSQPHAITLPWRETRTLPRALVTATTILEQMKAQIATVGSRELKTATYLFFAIGSPESIQRLQHACVAAKQSQNDIPLPPTSTAADYVRELDRLDATGATSSIIRRYFLACLACQYSTRQINSLSNDPKLRPRELKFGYAKTRRQTPNQGQRRAATRALQELLIEAYPDLANTPKSSAKYQRKIVSLKQRLSCAQKWDALAQRFSLGILSVIPTGTEFRLFNSQIETLHQRVFELLLDLLDENRGEFLRKIGGSLLRIYDLLLRRDMAVEFHFEELKDVYDLSYDSPSLSEACRESAENIAVSASRFG